MKAGTFCVEQIMIEADEKYRKTIKGLKRESNFFKIALKGLLDLRLMNFSFLLVLVSFCLK